MKLDDDLFAAIRAVVRAEIQHGLAPIQEQIAAVKTALEDRSDSPPVETVPDELILVGEAAKIAKRSQRTIRRWVRLYGIGRRLKNGRVLVSKPQLLDFVKNHR